MSSIEGTQIVTTDDDEIEDIEQLVFEMQLKDKTPVTDSQELESVEPKGEPPQPQAQPEMEDETETVHGIAHQLFETLGQIIGELPESAPMSDAGPSTSAYQFSTKPEETYKRLNDILTYWRSLHRIIVTKDDMDSDDCSDSN